MRSALKPELVQEKLKKLKERDAQMESRLDSQPMHRKKPMYQEDEGNTCSKQIKSMRFPCVLAYVISIDSTCGSRACNRVLSGPMSRGSSCTKGRVIPTLKC